jgi:5-formyltetrahydrofolate cyclo-ligase
MREGLTPAERIAAASGVASVLEQLPEFSVDQRVAGYWAVRGELLLHLVFSALLARGQSYHLPALAADGRLRFALWHPGTAVRTNRYGIPEPDVGAKDLLEPETLELVLVPLLAFDRRGHRLGSGAGYYDRSFAFLRDSARPALPLLVGIGYSFQEMPELSVQPWDVKMDFVATEKELIDCTTLPE